MEIEQVALIIEQLLAVIGHVWGEDSTIMQRIVSGAVLLTTIVGTASVLFKALEKIAHITPTTKDDEFVGKVRKWLSFLSVLLDRLALNPKRDANVK